MVGETNDEAINNPCRTGSAKWIVCEGALNRLSLKEVQEQLEEGNPGAGDRLSEYINDLRTENKLDIRIDGDVLVCLGYRK